MARLLMSACRLMPAVAVAIAVSMNAAGPADAQTVQFNFSTSWEDPPPPYYRVWRHGRPLAPMAAPRWDDEYGDEGEDETYADFSVHQHWKQRMRARLARRFVDRLPPVSLPAPEWRRRYQDDIVVIVPDEDDEQLVMREPALPQSGYVVEDPYARHSGIEQAPLPQVGANGPDFPIKPSPAPFVIKRTLPPPAVIVEAPPAKSAKKTVKTAKLPSVTKEVAKEQPAVIAKVEPREPTSLAPLPKQQPTTKPQAEVTAKIVTPKASPPKPIVTAPAATPRIVSPKATPPKGEVSTNVVTPKGAAERPKKQIVAKLESPKPQRPPAVVATTPPDSAITAEPAPKPVAPSAPVMRNGKVCPKGSEIEKRLTADGWSGFADPERQTNVVLMTAKRDGASYRLTLDRCTGVVLGAKLVKSKDS